MRDKIEGFFNEVVASKTPRSLLNQSKKQFDCEEVEREHVLALMHQEYWTDDLLGEMFEKSHRFISKKERFIIESKIMGLSDKEIARSMGIKVSSIIARLYSIKKKYRNQMNTRVDNYFQIRNRKK